MSKINHLFSVVNTIQYLQLALIEIYENFCYVVKLILDRHTQ